MNKKDRVTFIIFLLLVILIIIVIVINGYKNKKLENVDRKINYIMGYTENGILNKGETLFLQTLELINNKNIFDYVKDKDGNKKYYSIKEHNNYIKITNFSIAVNNFSKETLNDYITYKNIYEYKNGYYIKDVDNKDNNYIGSMLDIESYNNNEIIFKSIDYYCEDYPFIGIIYDEVKCDYNKGETLFKIILEKSIFKVNSIENFIQIEENEFYKK